MSLTKIILQNSNGEMLPLNMEGKKTIAMIEAIMITQCFITNSGRIGKTAIELGYSKNTIRKKLIEFNLINPKGGVTDKYTKHRSKYIESKEAKRGRVC